MKSCKNNTILIVEDDEDILELLEYTLQKTGFETIGFLNATPKIEQLLEEESIDLILMDRNLPMCDGITFIRKIKSKGINVPVIYISAKDKEENILEGFEAFADDYITKPFSLKEVVARVQAVIKRVNKDVEIVKIRDIIYQKSNKKFYIDEKIVELTQLEHDLLLEFMKNKSILLSREQLLYDVWKDSLTTKLKTVNVAIKRLKEKIDPKGKKGYIKSVRGEGYIFC